MADQQAGYSKRTLALSVIAALLVGRMTAFGTWRVSSHWQQYAVRCATARRLVDAVMLRFHWEKMTTDQEQKPFVDALGKSLQTQQYSWDFIRPVSPVSAAGQSMPRDEFEHNIVAEFDRQKASPDASALSATRVLTEDDGQRTFAYYQPIFAKAECLRCHKINGCLNEGDLMTVVKVKLPLTPAD